ncbi:MAG: hypothetical protein ACQXXH_00955 [Candidatus Bathyarchaeia archaeon]|jgi:hypothetical protein|nr:hypothetical protein [Candidatus Bathyarchaeota archaeon A05DMB-4]MDH7595978.1 hypothetical protein [Candidatus Bathyarchaeota archaeon]
MSKRVLFGLLLILMLTSITILGFSVPFAGAIISKKTYIFLVTWNDQIFYVVVETTSDISNFYFSQPNAEIGFNVSGPDGTYGSSNVSIPKSLLWVDNVWEWQVLIDGDPLDSVIFFNGTHTEFYLHYAQSTHKIQIIGTHTVGPLPERKVGVKVGDWAKYKVDFNYTTNDPNPVIPPPPYNATDVSYELEVVAIAGPVILFNSIIHFVNGTEISNVFNCDVSTGNGLSYYFIGANLSAGDRIYLTRYSPRINATLMKTYCGAEREVNYLNLKANTTSLNYQFIGEMHVYWDRASGIIVETIQTIEYINITEGYVTKMLGHMVITETNIWTSEKTLLCSGYGWFRVGPNCSVFGKVEVYRVGDDQIQLVLLRRGEEYSRTWDIVRRMNNRRNEFYFCRSQEYGTLIVHIQHAKRGFWLAVGRSTFAYGHL